MGHHVGHLGTAYTFNFPVEERKKKKKKRAKKGRMGRMRELPGHDTTWFYLPSSQPNRRRVTGGGGDVRGHVLMYSTSDSNDSNNTTRYLRSRCSRSCANRVVQVEDGGPTRGTR